MADAGDRPALDLKNGLSIAEIPPMTAVAGAVDADDVVLARSGDEFFAVGAHCTHYHGPLADGLIVGDTVRCPWHHACFDLRTGEAVRAPALDPVPCWRVERVGDRVFVREKLQEPPPRRPTAPATLPASVVIIGGGAAGLAAADMLRREGYAGAVTMLSADQGPPPDRPNLSKDFLAGTAQEDWIPLRPPEFYSEQRIDLRLDSRVASIDTKAKRIQLENGQVQEYGALLIATGAEPVRLDIAGAAAVPVHYLRTFADSQKIIGSAAGAKRALVVGASFIGLEVAASLRARGLAVDVAAPDKVPLERVMGPEVGAFIRRVHETRGVVFHLGTTVSGLDGRSAKLSDGSSLDVDLVVIGAGVRPSVALAEQAGLKVDRGIAVNEYLETSAPRVFAAGDIARWPDPHSGERIRVEHWVVAERQGQTAAKNILGLRVPYDAVPFFWSQHFDVTINYVGHAEGWDRVEIDGELDARDCSIAYIKGGRRLAVATIGRDRACLEAEVAMEASRGEAVRRT